MKQSNAVERGSAVMVYGSNVIGLVSTVDRSQGFAWVIWPDRSGLSECQPLDGLQAVCDRETVVQAIQVIAPIQQVSSPLERAFLQGARSSASSAIVEYDDNQARPYYRPKGR